MEQTVIIDPEFKKFLFRLDDKTFASLEADMLRHGCLEPLTTWRGILIDGYHRHEICVKHDIPFEVVEIKLPSRTDAKTYMIECQYEKDNLNEMQRSYLRGSHYNLEVKREEAVADIYQTIRPAQALQRLHEKYPGLDDMVSLNVGLKGEEVDWPDDVLITFPAWLVIVESYLYGEPIDLRGGGKEAEELFTSACECAAVGTWCYSKGIYRFSEALFDDLMATPLPDVLPMRAFRRLPDWCPYIELPKPYDGIFGFYCYLDHDPTSGAWELRIMPDTDDKKAVNYPIELSEGRSVVELIAPLDACDLSEAQIKAMAETQRKVQGFLLKMLRPCLLMLLYLCQDRADITNPHDPSAFPCRCGPRKTEDGIGYYEPINVFIWEVGRSYKGGDGEGLLLV